MTIQRQYQLPNCKLVLEGLADSESYYQQGLDVMSVLIDAQCHFQTQDKQVGGGMEFLQNLVAAASRYAQEFLSQTRSLPSFSDAISAVQLQPVDATRHCLLVYPESSQTEESDEENSGEQIYLSTLELFDLVEAIDQLLADRLTLPHLSLQLEALPKQYTQRSGETKKQAVPAAIGVASIAIAGTAFLWLPNPEVKRPQQLLPDSQESPDGTSNPASTAPTPTTTGTPAEPQTNTTTPEPTLDGEPTIETTPNAEEQDTNASTPPSAEEVAEALSIRPEVTDPNRLEALKWKLYNELETAWDTQAYREDLEYQVGVGLDGAILGYKHLNQSAKEQVESTPLPDLVYLPTSEDAPTAESIALFRVVFTDNGNLQVSPWRGYISEPDPPPQIQDNAKLRELQTQLVEQVTQALPEEPTFEEPLEYRVELSESGKIIDYEAQTRSARQKVSQTPLASLLEPAQRLTRGEDGAVVRAQVAEFRLVFQPGGTLEVSPWHGWR
jgi:hypothetical protein